MAGYRWKRLKDFVPIGLPSEQMAAFQTNAWFTGLPITVSERRWAISTVC